jgi:SAM-dependent methyltransferase
MREMAIQPKAVDLLMADFTLNFVSSLEDVNNFFREIRESLKEDGIALVSVPCNCYFLDQEKYGRYQENIPFSRRRSFSVYKGLGTRQLMFTLPQYIEIVQNNGLSVAVLARKDNEKMGPQFFLKIKINRLKRP